MSEEEDSANEVTVDKLDLILDELKTFKKYTSRKFDENKSITRKILDNFEDLKKDVVSLKKDNENQKKVVALQEEKIHTLEMRLLENTVSIQNVPWIKGEDLQDVVCKIALKLDNKLTTSSIVKVFRKKPKANGSSGDIVVKDFLNV